MRTPGPSELNFQTRLLALTRDAGGYGRKQTNRFKLGVPDLLLSVPTRANRGRRRIQVEAEVKMSPARHHQDAAASAKSPELALTEKQKQELERMGGGLVVVGLYTGKRVTHIAVMAWTDKQRFTRFTLTTPGVYVRTLQELTPSTWLALVLLAIGDLD